MFDVRLNSQIDASGSALPAGKRLDIEQLPPELKILTTLSYQWQPCAHILASGFPEWQLEKLFLSEIIEFGRGDHRVPRRARRYYAEQFPVKAAGHPLAAWSRAPPKIMWLGLPHTNLTRLEHSTAVGLADILRDANPIAIPVLGVQPSRDPSPACTIAIREFSALANLLGVRFGVIGGDHRATWSLLNELKMVVPSRVVQYIHIDAHNDIYGYNKNGYYNPINHANFLADLLHRNCVDQAVLFGCRDRIGPINDAQADGVRISKPGSMRRWRPSDWDKYGHTHLSIDLDILDPLVAPAVSSPLAEGWTMEKLMHILDIIFDTTIVDSCSVVESGGSNCETTQCALEIIERMGV